MLLVAVIAFGFSSCQTYNHSMREPNVTMRLTVDDLDLTAPISAEATVTRVLGIDWHYVFKTTKDGYMGSTPIPVLGEFSYGAAATQALYKLMQENPGYEVVVFPQVETHRAAPILGSDLYSTTNVKVTARLGKLKK